MHAQDAVVRGGKLIRMYKRPGHRVIINADGDLIVRPMFVEVRAAGLAVLKAALTWAVLELGYAP